MNKHIKINPPEDIEEIKKERDFWREQAYHYQEVAKQAYISDKGILVLLTHIDGEIMRVYGPDKEAEQRFAETVAQYLTILSEVSKSIVASKEKETQDEN